MTNWTEEIMNPRPTDSDRQKSLNWSAKKGSWRLDSCVDAITSSKPSTFSPNIILRIEDDGKGFEVERRLARSLEKKRMGLSSMEERVRLLNGTMDIKSQPSKGTRILIEVPCREKRDD